MSGVQFSTKDRILGAAEELFAQQGFAGTSLREVTGRADVNIAAVNYHFGSKDNLINEVFRRRMDVMSAQRLDALREALETRPGQLEPVLADQTWKRSMIARHRHGSEPVFLNVTWTIRMPSGTNSSCTCGRCLPREAMADSGLDRSVSRASNFFLVRCPEMAGVATSPSASSVPTPIG